jgi:hypothetical protein
MTRLTAVLTACGIALGLSGCADLPQSTAGVAPTTAQVAGPGVPAAYANPNVPGATGQSIVPGDNSTLSGDSAATLMQRTGRV